MTEKTVIPILKEHMRKKVDKDIGICVSPEFLTEIHGTWTDSRSFSRDFFSEERIVIGEFDKKAGDIAEQLYKPLNEPVFRTNLRTTEMIK